jgi:hypothetical protein
MNLHQFEKRFEKVQNTIGSIDETPDPVDISLLTADEQTRFTAILTHSMEGSKVSDFTKLSYEDLTSLELLYLLLNALKENDEQHASTLRERLSYTDDAIVAMFTDLAAGDVDEAELRRLYSPFGDSHANVLRRFPHGSPSAVNDMWQWLVKGVALRKLSPAAR